MTEEQQLIKFTPAQVSFGDFDQLSKQIADYVGQRKDLVVTPDTKKQVTAAKNEVGKYFTDLDDRRKAIKKEYEAPLKVFEAQFKTVTKPLVDLKKGYKDDLDEIAKQEAEQRRTIVLQEIADMCAPLGLDPADVEFDDRWLNKGMQKADGSSTVAALREISGAVQWAANQKQLEAERKRRIEEHAKAQHMDASGWTQAVSADTDTDAVIAQMDQAQAAQEHQTRVEHVDKETGELKAVTRTVRITGDMDRVAKLIDWLPSQNFEVTVID